MKRTFYSLFLAVFGLLFSLNISAQDELLWDYTETAPSASPDNGLTFASKVNDAAGTKNGLKGIKMNSSGYCYFTKNAVAGTLKLTFGPRDGAKTSSLDVYTYAETPSAETLIATTPEVEECQTVSIDLTADQNNIYIQRHAAVEQVLCKIQFVPVKARTFTDFSIDFTKDPYTVTLPETGVLPEGVVVNGTFHDGQHGYQKTTVTVPVDGTVKMTIGGCNYTNNATITNADGTTLATLDTKTAGCSGTVTYIYAGEATTLTINLGSYCPSLKVEACEVQPVVVTYKDQNGTVLGTKDAYEGDALGDVPYSESDLTIADGYAFRGWVYNSGVKVTAQDVLSGNTTVVAKVTAVESVSVGSVQNYNFASNIFYPEDHETITTEGGSYHDSTHGWAFSTDGKISVQVAGNAQIVIGLCKYSAEGVINVTDAQGNAVATIDNAKVETDGATASINYKGEATTLTFTFAAGTSYIHKMTVYNVLDFVEKDAATGYYVIPAGDGAAFLCALNSANNEDGAKIFLPNGTYDLGETTGTTISGNNMTIVGQGDVTIVTAPSVKVEGLGSADLLLNTSDGLYLANLTLKNALDYYGAGSAGRAAALHDKGNHTICKRVVLDSYQDTYYSNKDASYFYFWGGMIYGTVDYICGGGNAYFDGITLYNRSRSASEKSGECTMTAPYTAAADKGYVFDSSFVFSDCNTFNFGRSWKDGKCAFLNTKIITGKLVDTRWTLAGMNSAATSFKEYNTVGTNEGDNTPESYVATFTHKDGDKTYETILSKDQADSLSYDMYFANANWDPRSIIADASTKISSVTSKNLTMAEEGTYLVTTEEPVCGEFIAIFNGKEFNYDFDLTKCYSVLKANARGEFSGVVNFGVETDEPFADAIATPNVSAKSSTIYNLAGQRISSANKGVYIIDGKKVMK